MFWTFVAPKGGVGLSVVVAAVACQLSIEQPVTIVDFAGDQMDIFGLGAEPATPGVVDWLLADESVAVSALGHLAVDVGRTLRIISTGTTSFVGGADPQRCTELVRSLSAGGTVIADLGVVNPDPLASTSLIAAAGDRTTLVVRACYLALRRARSIPMVVDDVVEIVEGGRALTTVDIEAVLGQPVTARLPFDPQIARAVDAGLMRRRLPRSLRRLVTDLEIGLPLDRHEARSIGNLLGGR
jgi:hypothetical protein